MVVEKYVVVIEDGGFCLTKNKLDVLETDTIVCEVKDEEHGVDIIHGKGSNYINN